MNKKIFENSRICPKGDVEANWNKAVGFVPLDKEIIIYKADATHPAARFKVGDGKTVVQDLPFSGTDIEVIEKLIDEKGELLMEYIDNAVATIPQSDWEQNNENAEGFIKNKPFYYNEEELAYWDGTTSLDQIHINLYGSFSKVEPYISTYIKVSNDIILKDRFILATIDGNLVDSSKLYEYNGCYGYDMKKYSTELGQPIPGFGYYYVDMPALIIVMEDGIDISQCLTIHEPGAAKFKIDNPLLSKGIYASSSYRNETKIDIITLKQIDEKFIPKSIVNQEFDSQSEKAQSGIAIAGYLNEGMNLIGEAFQYIDEAKLDKTGGLISGNVSIQGNLSVGETNTTNGSSSSAFGTDNFANNRETFVHGFGNTANGNFAYSSGFYNVSHADISHTEGQGNVVGDLTQVAVRDTGEGGHAEGFGNLVLGKYAHAGGANNIAKGDYSKSDGVGGSDWAHPENSEIADILLEFDTTNYIKNTNILHGISYTAGNNLTYFSGARFTSGTQSFSEFVERINAGDFVNVVHASGVHEVLTVHSKGLDYFYLFGKVEWLINDTYIAVQAVQAQEDVISGTSAGVGSSVSGFHNYALQDYQTVIGKYNKNKEDTLFEVGNGTDNDHRENAFEVCNDNTAKINGKNVATEDYVDGLIAELLARIEALEVK